MTKIIGHRGAAGSALENSRASLRAAIAHGVDAIELDVHRTRDNQLVVMHDQTTRRIAPVLHDIADVTLDEALAIELHNGERLLSLDEALDILGRQPVIIDIKDINSVEPLLAVLERHPKSQPGFASFHHDELRLLRQALPEAPIYVLEHFKPIEIVQNARRIKATGIGLNKWLMNPLTYWLARRHGLELYVYTVNSRRLAWFLRRLYPAVAICSDRPEYIRR